MKEKLEEIRSRALAQLGDDAGAEAIEAVRVAMLGRAGELTEMTRRMREVAPESRREIGQLINSIKHEIEARIAALAEARRLEALERSLDEAHLDVTLPGLGLERGRPHPVQSFMERMVRIFLAMGFEAADTRDIEDDFHNFAALNFPPDHPAREMQDTFFVDGGLLLRTHTSTGQVRVMEQRKPPLAVICPGNCFRVDELSVRATPMFSQIEGFMVDRAGAVTMAHLKGVLSEFARALFGSATEVRFRASYFPFTEPSAELDVRCPLCHGQGCPVCKGSGWTEILGSGMIHPNVLHAVGLDPAAFAGFAFGIGVERTALLGLGVDDMRLFFQNDMRFLSQFPALGGGR